MEEITNFLTKGKSRLSLPDKTPVLDMLSSGDKVNPALLIKTEIIIQLRKFKALIVTIISRVRHGRSLVRKFWS